MTFHSKFEMFSWKKNSWFGLLKKGSLNKILHEAYVEKRFLILKTAEGLSRVKKNLRKVKRERNWKLLNSLEKIYKK